MSGIQTLLYYTMTIYRQTCLGQSLIRLSLITDSGFVMQQATGYDLKILQQPVFSVYYLS